MCIRDRLKLIFGDEPDDSDSEHSDYSDDEEEAAWAPAVLEVGMKEVDLSNKNLGVGGAIIVDAWISHKDNGAMVSVNILYNGISTKQAQNLATVLKEHATLKSLCGNKGDESELDMSGKNMGTDGAIMLAPEIVANGALTSLNISTVSYTHLTLPTKA